jgi:predicted secreted Zn-dependent protease
MKQLILFIGWAICVLPSFPADKIEHAQIVYYDIKGSSDVELRKSMNELRPRDPYDGNRPVDSYTDWHISWNWLGYGNYNCDLASVTASFKIKITMPRWKDQSNASPELVAKWEKYMECLVSHEKKHVDIVVNNYPKVLNAIQNSTCSTAEQEAQKILALLRKYSAEYDRETKHGTLQGAMFP